MDLLHTRLILLLLAVLTAATSATARNHDELNVAILGDSNIWIGGDDCAKPKGWPKWFADDFRPASICSFARSGATWTNTASTTRDTEAYTEVLDNNNVIYNQVQRLFLSVDSKKKPAPDIIFIAAGTNDAWFTKKRPGVFADTPADAFADSEAMIADKKPASVLSLAKSVRYNCEMLMCKFPEAQIVLVTPAQATVCGYDDLRKACDIIEECGRRMGIAVIRLDEGPGVYHTAERLRKNMTYDGVHTSEKGAERIGHFIANRLRSILCF